MSALKAKKPTAVKPGRVKGLLYGASGAGKTWFALRFPAPYFIDTEAGADQGHYMKRLDEAGGAYLGPQDGACDFDTIRSQVRALMSERHQYKTLVIDSITKVFQLAIQREADKMPARVNDFGQSKKPAIAAMRRLIADIHMLDMNVWFVAHEVAVWGGEGNDRRQIGTGPDVWGPLVYELDLVLQVNKHSRGNRTVEVAKSRLETFPDFDRFPIQENGKDCGYANFMSRYGAADAVDADAQQVALATAEQIAEIESLLAIVKIPEADVQKWLDKANADTWSDLNAQQAQGVIDLLNKKRNGKAA